jgi:hypothetical protein
VGRLCFSGQPIESRPRQTPRRALSIAVDRAGAVPPFRGVDTQQQKVGALKQDLVGYRSYLRSQQSRTRSDIYRSMLAATNLRAAVGGRRGRATASALKGLLTARSPGRSPQPWEQGAMIQRWIENLRCTEESFTTNAAAGWRLLVRLHDPWSKFLSRGVEVAPDGRPPRRVAGRTRSIYWRRRFPILTRSSISYPREL